MQLVQWMLATNVVWDFISTYILLGDSDVLWCQRIERMHTDWWTSEKDNTPSRVASQLYFCSHWASCAPFHS